jgi:hypothetical protein
LDGNGQVVRALAHRYVYDGPRSVIGEVDETGDLKSSGPCDVYGAARIAWTASGETVSRYPAVHAD